MKREDLSNFIENAPPEALPDLIRDLEAAKARALARIATWAAAPRNPDVEPVTVPQTTEILEQIAETARVRRPGYSPRFDPDTDREADHVPSAKGMFSCMVMVGIMLILYLVLWMIISS